MAIKPFESLNSAYLIGHGKVFNGVNGIQDALKTLQVAELTPDGGQLKGIALNSNVTNLTDGYIAIEITELESLVNFGGVLLLRANETSKKVEYSADSGNTWTEMGAGEEFVLPDDVMLKSVYDTNDNQRADWSEWAQNLYDGTNAVSPAELRTHLDNHPSGVTDHTALTNIGTKTHAQIDAHLDAGYGYGHEPLDIWLDDLTRQIDRYGRANEILTRLSLQKAAGASQILTIIGLSEAFVDAAGITAGVYTHDASNKWVTLTAGNQIDLTSVAFDTSISHGFQVWVWASSGSIQFKLQTSSESGFSPEETLTLPNGDKLMRYQENSHYGNASAIIRIIASLDVTIKGVYATAFQWPEGV